MEETMRKLLLLAATGGLLATGASAAPLIQQGNKVAPPTATETVRLVCRQDGRCYQTGGGRRYVQRRYYDDSYAYGPRGGYGPGYGGPGYYDGGYNSGPSIGFSFGGGGGRW
jgi:hypothetical protein